MMIEECLPLEMIAQLSPEECAHLLRLGCREEFVWFMRRQLTQQENERVTDEELSALHAAYCESLRKKLDEVRGSLGLSRSPAHA